MAHSPNEAALSTPVAPSDNDAAGLPGRIMKLINKAIVALASVALVVASIVLTYGVVTRYFLHWSTDWQDELSVFLIVGSVFLSAAAVQATRGHVGIEAVSAMLSPAANRWRLFFVDIATFLFCGFFAWKSGLLLQEAIVDNYHSSSTWAPPLWIPYSLMTAGMALLTLQVLVQIVVHFRTRSPR